MSLCLWMTRYPGMHCISMGSLTILFGIINFIMYLHLYNTLRMPFVYWHPSTQEGGFAHMLHR